MKTNFFIATIIGSTILSICCCTSPSDSLVKPRVLISTDIGGTDPDDNQSMVHLLMYSDRFEIEGLVSSPSYGDGSKEEILRMIDLYGRDYPALASHAPNLMHPDSLRPLCKQGARGAVGMEGFRAQPTEGSEWIVKCARKPSNRPLWVLVWGGLDDVAQALHDAPDIKQHIRVIWIGGPNKKWSVNSYAYIATHHSDLWMIENNASYRGFISNNKVADRYNRHYYTEVIEGAGCLGDDFKNYYNGLVKMGDTPTLLYLMYGNAEDPTGDSWGGSFEPVAHSARRTFDRLTTDSDTVPVYSVVEMRLKGPLKELPVGHTALTMTIDKQQWPGYYTGGGEYLIRYSPKAPATLPYTITSPIPGLDGLSGILVVGPQWTDAQTTDAFSVGPHWFTDKSAPELFEGKWQGAATTSRHRCSVLDDWAVRWQWLKQ